MYLETVEYEPPDSDSDEAEEEEDEDEEDNSMWQEDALVYTVNNESGFSCKKTKSSENVLHLSRNNIYLSIQHWIGHYNLSELCWW